MEEELNLHEVYVRVPGGFAVYQGGANFLSGKRKCPECSGLMVREPTNQPFVRVEGGCVLVNTMGTTGRMLLSNTEPDYTWVCKFCPNTIAASINPKTAPTIEVPDEKTKTTAETA